MVSVGVGAVFAITLATAPATPASIVSETAGAASCPSDGVITHDGAITKALAAPILDALYECPSPILSIASEGGDVEAAIAIAEALEAADGVLIVRDRCLSSCANYIFLGASERRLDGPVVLGFHGFVSDLRPPQAWFAGLLCRLRLSCAAAEQRAAVRALQGREATFFDRLEIDVSKLAKVVKTSLERARAEIGEPSARVVVSPASDAWAECFGPLNTDEGGELRLGRVETPSGAVHVVETRGALC